jgi:hypothetical protein
MELGRLEAVKDRVRGAGWESVLETFWRALRYVGRILRRTPGFTAVAVAMIALEARALHALVTAMREQ